MTKKKVNKINPVNWNWKKISAVIGIGVVSFAGAGLGVRTYTEPVENVVNVEQINTSNFATKADLIDTNIALAEVTNIVKSTNEIVVENDVWESTAEILALNELEDRDYRDLRKELVDEDSEIGTDANLDVDYDDIEDFEVTIRNVDVTFTTSERNSKDAIVVFKLKVEYENDIGDDVNKYVNATATIEDGEVEDLVFTDY